ncbi:uncharacterized protein TNCV_2997151 [Trichonephila clavipes]|nr:uncharacterized protein TNCV_2997151 [Trichonephila clavipes]
MDPNELSHGFKFEPFENSAESVNEQISTANFRTILNSPEKTVHPLLIDTSSCETFHFDTLPKISSEYHHTDVYDADSSYKSSDSMELSRTSTDDFVKENLLCNVTVSCLQSYNDLKKTCHRLGLKFVDSSKEDENTGVYREHSWSHWKETNGNQEHTHSGKQDFTHGAQVIVVLQKSRKVGKRKRCGNIKDILQKHSHVMPQAKGKKSGCLFWRDSVPFGQFDPPYVNLESIDESSANRESLLKRHENDPFLKHVITGVKNGLYNTTMSNVKGHGAKKR